MKFKTKSLIGISIVLSLALIGGTGLAKEKKPENNSIDTNMLMQEMMYKRDKKTTKTFDRLSMTVLMDLNLTPEQFKKLNQIKMEHYNKVYPLKLNIKKKQAELDAVMEQLSPDMKVIEQKVIELNKLKTDLQLAVIEFRLSTDKILTKEQQEQLKNYTKGNKQTIERNIIIKKEK